MKIPLSWLNQYIPLKQSPAELAKILTMLGIEVEAIETFTPSFTGVVVGKVVETSSHPNAESLQLLKVTNGQEVVSLVCGDMSVVSGEKIALCQVGAKLEDEKGETFKIRKAKIRGEESFGMLASAKELKISDDDEGVLRFPEDTAEGLEVASFFNETIFDVALTPNLGYAASLIGVARELSAFTSQPYTTPPAPLTEETKKVSEVAKVDVRDPEGCPRYAARVVEGVRVGPSPQWLQEKLVRAGLRPVNNVVDVTNFVLLETGQPLHAFDLKLLKDQQIVVRRSIEGEHLVTLDDKCHTLKEGSLIIADSKNPVALAGVMGGKESEVTEKTVDILIESAHFHPSLVRKMSKEYQISSDASRRFERGADFEAVRPALDRAASLIQQLAGGRVLSEPIDQIASAPKTKTIPLRFERVNYLLGTLLSPSEIETVFERLSFPFQREGEDQILVTIPSYRVDIFGEVDLIEEVARLYSFDNIPKKESRYVGSSAEDSPLFLMERSARKRAAREGLQEFLTCDLISPSMTKLVQGEVISEESVVKVTNPTSIEQSILRPSLLPGLLGVVKHNFDQQIFNVSGFEVGRIHLREGDEYREPSMLGVILTGKARPHHWEAKPHLVDFYDLKGILENLLEGLSLSGMRFVPSELHTFHPGRQAKLFVDEALIGSFGELHPSLTREWGIKERVYYAEISLNDVLQLQQKVKKLVPLSLYPSSSRDWTVTMKEEVPSSDVIQAIEKSDSKLLESVELRDLFVSDRIGQGLKNVTFRFTYRNLEKTVQQKEVDQEHEKITSETLKQLGKAVI